MKRDPIDPNVKISSTVTNCKVCGDKLTKDNWVIYRDGTRYRLRSQCKTHYNRKKAKTQYVEPDFSNVSNHLKSLKLV